MAECKDCGKELRRNNLCRNCKMSRHVCKFCGARTQGRLRICPDCRRERKSNGNNWAF